MLQLKYRAGERIDVCVPDESISTVPIYKLDNFIFIMYQFLLSLNIGDWAHGRAYRPSQTSASKTPIFLFGNGTPPKLFPLIRLWVTVRSITVIRG